MSVGSAIEELMEKGLSGDGQESRRLGELYNGEVASPTTSATLTAGQVEIRDSMKAPFRSVFRLKSWWKDKKKRKLAEKTEESPTIIRPFTSYPSGYPRLASIIDSDERFMLYRRFGILQTRLLLYKQDELRLLESRLDDLDQNCLASDHTLLASRAREDMVSDKRNILMSEIESKYQAYGELLILSRDIASLESPTLRNYLDIKRYFDLCKPLSLEETYIGHQSDIITLMPSRDITWLDNLIQKMFDKFERSQNKFMRACPTATPYMRVKVAQKADIEHGITLYSSRRYDAFVTLIVLALITALMILPVYVIWQLTRGSDSISIIICVLLVFTLVFCLVLLKFTRAKRHEILAAAAGYCAVLVTFMGNVGQLNTLGSGNAVQNGTTNFFSG
ncbi:uncharacterized protein LY89DRAFT_731891 [Mollisia scopiformis]|uniref:DUF6594 domain-containing protein n=1 Tax=Mollisia scopiformis TaxID=149040 RepID=A0A194XH52_MOLSC|nr:uncharacterized protein LY89DRAFT_731891 [Mollisia scopiformis]KUJ19493.1 hypothetical protein LY89DRAFT_731891 [Mollisia scopiformis]